MPKPKSREPIKETFVDPEMLSEHWANLDVAYRKLQIAFQAITYEAGRIEDEPEFSDAFGDDLNTRMLDIADKIQKVGLEIKALGLEEKEIAEV